MNANLETTNLLLGIMAAVSVLEGLLIIGLGVAAFRMYRTVIAAINNIEEHHIAPTVARANAMFDEVHAVAESFRNDKERVQHAIRSTIDRVDDTAIRVRDEVRTRASWIIGTIRGVRRAVETVLRSESDRGVTPSSY